MNINVKHTLQMRIKELERLMPENSKAEQINMQKEIEAHEDAVDLLEILVDKSADDLAEELIKEYPMPSTFLNTWETTDELNGAYLQMKLMMFRFYKLQLRKELSKIVEEIDLLQKDYKTLQKAKYESSTIEGIAWEAERKGIIKVLGIIKSINNNY